MGLRAFSARVLMLATVIVIGVAVLPAAAGQAATAHPAAGPRSPDRSVAQILRPDGYMRERGVSGSFDPAGYRMVLGQHGAPRFVRSSADAAGAAGWDDRVGDPGVQGFLGAQVSAVVVHGGDVYVGGSFGTAGGAPHADLAEWDGRSWQSLSGGVSGAPADENPQGSALALDGSTLYVGGIFATAHNGGTAVAARDVAAWNITTRKWSALGAGITAGSTCGFCSVRVTAFAVSGSDVFAAGEFGKAGTVAATSIAEWNGARWSALGRGLSSCTECSPVQAGTVGALVLSGGTLYAGGSFEDAGTGTANNVAAWSLAGATWRALGAGVQAGFDGGVFALAVHGGSLIAGGDFTQAGSVAVNSVAVW